MIFDVRLNGSRVPWDRPIEGAKPFPYKPCIVLDGMGRECGPVVWIDTINQDVCLHLVSKSTGNYLFDDLGDIRTETRKMSSPFFFCRDRLQALDVQHALRSGKVLELFKSPYPYTMAAGFHVM